MKRGFDPIEWTLEPENDAKGLARLFLALVVAFVAVAGTVGAATWAALNLWPYGWMVLAALCVPLWRLVLWTVSDDEEDEGA